MEQENSIKTLADYYEALPRSISPKKEFVKRIAERTKREIGTVRLWLKTPNKPSNPEILQILSEETGIPQENLFEP